MNNMVNIIKECKKIDNKNLAESLSEKLILEFDRSSIENPDKQSVIQWAKVFFARIGKIISDRSRASEDYKLDQQLVLDIVKTAKVRLNKFGVPSLVLVFLEKVAKLIVNTIGYATASLLSLGVIMYGWYKFEQLIEIVSKKDSLKVPWISKLALTLSATITVPIAIICYYIIIQTKDYVLGEISRGTAFGLAQTEK